jgi:DTW domain-containing protein YfiP
VRHLIVPDGTWTQARRIERRCFAASGLPRISLDAGWPSVYSLRRGREGSSTGESTGLHSGGSSGCHSGSYWGCNSGSYSGLCTFEASAVALGLLGHAALAGALLERFVEWVRRAQRLKAGGGPLIPEVSRSCDPHPALERLHTFAAR